MSRDLDLAACCTGSAVFQDVAVEAWPEVLPGDQVVSTVIAKMARRGVVVMLPEYLLPCAALVWHLEPAAIVE